MSAHERKESALQPPCAYQGGKQRLAKAITSIIRLDKQYFYDLCCGSGAVSLAFRSKGVSPDRLVLVDKSPWGLFWQEIGRGTFSLKEFRYHLDQLPANIEQIPTYLRTLSQTLAEPETCVYIYLLLQSGSFGSKAIWIDGGRWRNCTFRSYWKPTAISSRHSPVNPMMPMPDTLYERVCRIAEAMYGCQGIWGDVRDVQISENSVVYIDPPYQGTTAYGFNFDVLDFVKSLNVRAYVSEAVPLSPQAVQVSGTRSKGGISGVRQTANQEWISCFNGDIT